MEMIIDTMETGAADKVARYSPSVEKAKKMKGMPKKAKLPKIVLRTKRYRVFFENLKTK